MSVQAMSWVIDHAPEKGAEFVCLLMIANYAHPDGSGAYPSIKTLAKDCRMSARQTARIVAHLEGVGAIRVKHGGGRGSTNTYTIVMDDARKPVNLTVIPDENPDNLTAFPEEDATETVPSETGNDDKFDAYYDKAVAKEPRTVNNPYAPAGAGRAEGGDTSKAGTTPAARTPRPPDPLWEAVCRQIGVDPAGRDMTSSARGQINAAVKEIRGAGGTPEEVARRAARYRSRHPDWEFTANALAKHWPTLGDARPVRAAIPGFHPIDARNPFARGHDGYGASDS